jgi:hypothetical protein
MNTVRDFVLFPKDVGKKPLIQDKLTALMKRRCEDLGLDPRQFSL